MRRDKKPLLRRTCVHAGTSDYICGECDEKSKSELKSDEDCSNCKYDGHIRAALPCALCEDGSEWAPGRGRGRVPRHIDPMPQADGDNRDLPAKVSTVLDLNPDKCMSVDEIWYDSLAGKHQPEQVRPSFREIYMRMAQGLAMRSTCARLQVGCVITSMDFRKVLAVGYNGGASGQENRCDSDEPGMCGCLHAEENAVINCDAPRYVEKIVFCTHMPCRMCAKRLVNLGGVQIVYYAQEYRLADAPDILLPAAIRVVRLEV